LYTTLLIFGSKTRKTDAFNPLLILKTQPKHEAIHNLLCTFLVIHNQLCINRSGLCIHRVIHSGCS
jgi:hypothetical protein